MLKFHIPSLARTSSSFFLLLVSSLSVPAATYSAASARDVDVQAKVNLAQDGDTVVVPAGTVRWTAGVTVTKNITLRGAGVGRTIILDEVPRAPHVHAVTVQLSKDLPFRFTGFEIRGSPLVTANSPGVVQFRGARGLTRRFRFDHCKLSNLYGLPVRFTDVLGVVDHCTFQALNSQTFQISHATWGGEDYGHGSWADYPYWGSDKFLFFEDCTFSNSNSLRDGLDAYEGARYVVRHCTLNDADVTCHGTEAKGRGAKQIEIYNNVFNASVGTGAAQLRSGTVIVHDNVYNNFVQGMDLKAYRQMGGTGEWGISNGSNVWDINGSTLAFYERGTHTGVNAATTLVDANKNWIGNQWETAKSRKGFSYVLRNITQNRQSYIVSNTSTTVSYFHSSSPMHFNRGDNYQIWKVITTLDQPGQGKSDLLFGRPAQPRGWPHSVVEPCYSWNNTGGSGQQMDLHSGQGSIEEGRDYFNRTRRPNYAPYIYPHPLTAAP